MNIKKLIGIYSGLKRDVYVIFFARIINCIGNFVYPFLTIFLTQNLGMSKVRAGVFLLVASTMFVPGSAIGGKIADIFGRKKIMLIFQGLAALCLVPCAYLGKSIVIPYFLIAASLFGGIAQPASGAMMMDLTDADNRKQAFSLLYLGTNIGSAVGPMIAGILYNHYLKWLFIGDAATTLISLVLIAVYIKESIPTVEDMDESIKSDTGDEKAEEGSVFTAILKRPVVLVFVILSSIYAFIYSQHAYSIPLQLNEIFKSRGPEIFGTLMSVNAICVIALTTLITGITKKLQPIFNVTLAGLFYTAGFSMLYFVNSYHMFILSTIIWTIGEILNATNEGVYIANHTPMSHRGRFNSIISIIGGTGYAVGPVLMGKYIGMRSARSAWVLVLYLGIISSTLMYMLYIFEKKTVQKFKNTEELKIGTESKF